MLDKFHAKLLYSSAYRAPNIANSVDSGYSLNIPNATGTIFPIKKETTRILELEVGGMPITGLMLTANSFAQIVNDVIVYDPDFKNHTKNSGRIGSMGMEAQAEYAHNAYHGLVNMSYVEPGIFAVENGNVVRTALDAKPYLTPDGKNQFLGVPSLKMYTNHTYAFTDQISATANMLLYGLRYQFATDDNSGEPIAKKISLQTVFGMGVNVRDVYVKGLEITLTVHDLLNEQIKYVSTFDTYLFASHPFSSLNYKGREISLTAQYSF